MNNHVNRTQRNFRQDMSRNNLEPEGEIIFDGEPHEYEARVNDKHKSAKYSAAFYDFEDDHNKPFLIGWYGLINDKAQYIYSSLLEKK